MCIQLVSDMLINCINRNGVAISKLLYYCHNNHHVFSKANAMMIGIRPFRQCATRNCSKSWNYLKKMDIFASTTFRGDHQLLQLLYKNECDSWQGKTTQLDIIDLLVKKIGGNHSNWPPSLYEQNFFMLLKSTDKRTFLNLNKNEMILLLAMLSKIYARREPLQCLHDIDLECARRVSMWGVETCLLVFDVWVTLSEYQAVQTSFFKVLLKEWTLLSGCSKPHHLVQLLYYISLHRSAPENLMLSMENWLETNVSLLSMEDVAIVCQGYFQSKHRIQSVKILSNIAQRITDMLDMQQFDSFVFLCYIKVLRHARYEDVTLSMKASEFIKTILMDTNLTKCAHFAAFFATNRYYDGELFSKFEAKLSSVCEAEIQTVLNVSDKYRGTPDKLDLHHIPNLARMKDVSRILWAISDVVHSPKKYFFELISKYLRLRIQKDFNRLEQAYYIDCLHSLAIMGVFLDDLIVEFATLKTNRTWTRKSIKQIHLLNESMKIECYHQTNVHEAHASNNIHHSKHLSIVLDIVKSVCDGNEDLFICYNVLPHIPIAGIVLLYTKPKIAVEVIETSSYVQNRSQPVGMHMMKCRQLTQLGYKVVQIFPEHVSKVEKLNSSEKILWFRQNVF